MSKHQNGRANFPHNPRIEAAIAQAANIPREIGVHPTKFFVGPSQPVGGVAILPDGIHPVVIGGMPLSLDIAVRLFVGGKSPDEALRMADEFMAANDAHNKAKLEAAQAPKIQEP